MSVSSPPKRNPHALTIVIPPRQENAIVLLGDPIDGEIYVKRFVLMKRTDDGEDLYQPVGLSAAPNEDPATKSKHPVQVTAAVQTWEPAVRLTEPQKRYHRMVVGDECDISPCSSCSKGYHKPFRLPYDASEELDLCPEAAKKKRMLRLPETEATSKKRKPMQEQEVEFQHSCGECGAEMSLDDLHYQLCGGYKCDDLSSYE